MKRADVIITGLVIVGVFGLVFAGQTVSQAKFSSQSIDVTVVGACSGTVDQSDVCELKAQGCGGLTDSNGKCQPSEANGARNGFSNSAATGSDEGGESYGNGSYACPVHFYYDCLPQLPKPGGPTGPGGLACGQGGIQRSKSNYYSSINSSC